MFQRVAFLSVALALTLSSIFVGCGSDDSTGPGDTGPAPADFSGNWDFSGQVIARKTCDNEIDDTRDWDVVITQNGNVAIISINGGAQTALTVSGSTATGSKTEGEMLDFALTIDAGEIGGTITAVNMAVPCTEVWAVVGTRTNTAPSSSFNGSWDLAITVTASGCDGETVGFVDEVCRSIVVEGNTVTIADEDGAIAGVGDGDTAHLTRANADGTLEVTITVNGNNLTGDVTFFDNEGQCEVSNTLVGTRRTTPCPPPATPGDFAGSWSMTISVTASECFDETIGDSFDACMTATVEGTSITLLDISSEGPISGEIDGNTAVLTRNDQGGMLTVRIELDGDQIAGTATMVYSGGDCAGATVEYSLDGTRRESACGGGSGPFNGFWNVSGNFITNGCELSIDTECAEIIQDGNSAFFVGDGFTGTVSGNTLTYTETLTEGTTTFSIDLVLTISGNGNSFAGTQSLSFTDSEFPQFDCESIANLAGTRTSSCNPARPAFSPGFGAVRR